MRAQTSLPALGFALLVLTAVMVFGVAVADGALLGADRSALERQTAVDLSDRLVSPDVPLTDRRNVINATVLTALDGQRLRTRYGLASGTDATISVGGDTVASTGDTRGGTTISRLVVVRTVTERTIRPAFTGGNRVTLPRRTDNATIDIDPRENTTVTIVRSNGRVILHNDSGLRGTYDVSLSPYRTVTLQFVANASLSSGSVDISYYPERTRKEQMEVRVDG